MIIVLYEWIEEYKSLNRKIDLRSVILSETEGLYCSSL